MPDWNAEVNITCYSNQWIDTTMSWSKVGSVRFDIWTAIRRI